MKFRRGFVSNSSSSSFIALVERNAHEKIMSLLDEKTRKMIKNCIEGESDFCDTPYVKIQYIYLDGTYSHEHDWLEEFDYEDRKQDVAHKLKKEYLSIVKDENLSDKVIHIDLDDWIG